MEHPTTAAGDWQLHHMVYDDHAAGVAVALMHTDNRTNLAVRWLAPAYDSKDKSKVLATGLMGGETGWFVLPFDFGVAIGRALIERHAAGLREFDEAGFRGMVAWLVEFEAVSDALCY